MVQGHWEVSNEDHSAQGFSTLFCCVLSSLLLCRRAGWDRERTGRRVIPLHRVIRAIPAARRYAGAQGQSGNSTSVTGGTSQGQGQRDNNPGSAGGTSDAQEPMGSSSSAAANQNATSSAGQVDYGSATTGTATQASTDATDEAGRSKKAGRGTSTLSGCLAGPNDDGTYSVRHGSKTVEVEGDADLSKDVGHSVKLHGNWITSVAEVSETQSDSHEKEAKAKKDERRFRVTKIDRVWAPVPQIQNRVIAIKKNQ